MAGGYARNVIDADAKC